MNSSTYQQRFWKFLGGEENIAMDLLAVSALFVLTIRHCTFGLF